jgi:hypothetical protein
MINHAIFLQIRHVGYTEADDAQLLMKAVIN